MVDSWAGPFAISPVRGARAFNLTADGWLTGVTYPYHWRPGINYATCRRAYNSDDVYPEPDHSLWECESQNNGHGFYGYFDGSNNYRSPTHGKPEAVIEGYGTGKYRPVIGDRGFRAGVAEIVALCFPSMLIKNREAYEIAMRRYAGIPIFPDFDAMIEEFPLDNGDTYRGR